MSARTFARSFAVVTATALLLAPAASAQAAAKKKVPAPSITAKPASPTNVRTATFGFTDATAGVTYQCSLDGAAWATCASPKAYAGPFSAATHSFRVRARDKSGSLSAFTSASWVVDLTAPPVPALSGVPAPSPTKTTSASLAFSDTEAGVTYRCAFDGAAAAACTSPVAKSALADGTHTFAVSARDAAGNVSAPVTGTWTIDTTPPPAPSVTTGPASLTDATTATFDLYEADGAATLTCSLDGGAYTACTSPVTYTKLSETTHTLDVRAADALGNAVNATQFTWTVDKTAPAPPVVVVAPGPVTGDNTASFTFDGQGATTLQCSLDGATFTACPTTYDTPALSDGTHTLTVKGMDAASNASGGTPYTWTVDTTPPPAAVVTGPATYTTAQTATFTITDAEDLLTYTCALDGAAAATCASGVSYSGLVEGTHSLAVTATDAAGNSTPTTFGWHVDLTAPTSSATLPKTVASAALLAFNEPVRGVSGASYVLRVTGTTTPVAASLTCTDASAVLVSCASGPVRVARLAAAGGLIPGQRYTLVANPGGAATVTDLAGNALAPKSYAFRAQTAIENESVAVRYTWRNVATTAAYGGGYRTESRAGASASYGFTGTAVTWYTVKGRTQGVADVYVDGVKKASVNNYATTTTYHAARTLSGLSSRAHVLKVVVHSGYVSIDAVKIGATLTSTPALTMAWARSATAGASGGALSCSDQTSADTTMRFRGTAVAWWTSTGRNRGIARLYVDGVLKGTYDTYAAATAYNVRRLVTGLTDAVHTVRVVVTGTHRSGATGSLVCLDRFTVG